MTPKPMRYLLYTETFPSRRPEAPRQTGIGRYCADLADGLSQLGHDLTVLTNDEVGPAGGGVREPYRVELLGATPRTPLERWRRRRQVEARAAAVAPDFLLVGDPLGHRVMAGAGSSRLSGICPILHGTEVAAWGRMRRSKSRSPRAKWLDFVRGRYVRLAHSVICNSRFTEGLLRAFVGGPGRVAIVYPCVSTAVVTRPVDPDSRDTLRRRLGSPNTVFMTIARISERKNQLTVVEALERLAPAGNGAYRYAIVGNTDAREHERYRERLAASIERSDLSSTVTFIEGASDDDKIAWLDACDVFVMLSQTVGDSVEGFGISAIEAACRRKPVVVSDQGGMPETVLEGRTGVALPPGDAARLAEVLAELARDPERRHRMGEAGRRFVLENFTPRIMAERLHEQLTAGAPAARRRSPAPGQTDRVP